MGSAKVNIKVQDRSAIVPALDGVYAGITVVSEKGPVGVPRLITNTNQFIDTYGEPNPKLGTAMYSALNYLADGNKLWVVRAAHDDITYSGALVRSKIHPIPTDATETFTDDSLIVDPLDSGMTQQDLDSYVFPSYQVNKLYEAVDTVLFDSVNSSNSIRVDNFYSLEVGNKISITNKTIEALNDDADMVGENEPTLTIESLTQTDINYENIVVDTAVTVAEGDEVLYTTDEGTTTQSFSTPIYVVRDADDTTNILVDDADLIAPSDILVIGGSQTTFIEKTIYTETANIVEVDAPVTLVGDESFFRVTQSQFEDRDAFLVLSAYQGRWGNDLSIGIADSKNYDNAFIIIVYYKGVQVETWEVTREPELDGFGRQLEMEQKINGNSGYIQVLNNQSNTDEDGNYPKPLKTDYSLWRKAPEDVFIDSTNTLTENLLEGHIEVKLSGTTDLSLGTRIKFVIGEDEELSSEYKVQALDDVNSIVTLDRPVQEDSITSTWVDGTGTSIDTKVYWFDNTLSDSANGIIEGVQYYPISKIDKVYYNYPLNVDFVIDGTEGTLVSAGANMTTGGSLGSTATVGDLITAVKKLSNKEATPVTLLMDGGFTQAAYALAIKEVCEAQGLTHGYLSSPYEAEEAVDYLSAIVEYKNDTNLNTELCSMFSGWVRVYDEYNQLYVWVSPEGFAAAAQSYTSRNYNMWTPAAGWLRGKIDGLGVKVEFTEGDRDYLVDNRINPVRRKEGSGLVIWGNETMLSRPSPLQLRSVAMLLIVIKHGLEGMLEFKTFDLNNERTWNIVEGTLDGFMRDEIKAKGGVYNYEVAVQDVITNSDIDNRRMPVFLGIQPTMDIQMIPVTLAIFNRSVDINVAL